MWSVCVVCVVYVSVCWGCAEVVLCVCMRVCGCYVCVCVCGCVWCEKMCCVCVFVFV